MWDGCAAGRPAADGGRTIGAGRGRSAVAVTDEHPGCPVTGLAASLRKSYACDLGPTGAFLPERVPVDRLPEPLEPYLAACAELPDHYAPGGRGVRAWLDGRFSRDPDAAVESIATLGRDELDSLMTFLSALGHTYRWDRVPPAAERFAEHRIDLPPGIARPWSAVARRLDQPRVGTTWSLHLCNWVMPGRPGGSGYRPGELATDRIRIACNWLPPPVGGDLERFSLAFVLLEAKGAGAIAAVVDAIEGVARHSAHEVTSALARMRAGIEAMTLAFSASVNRRTVDPGSWLHLVQPTFAWSAEREEPGAIEGGPSGLQSACVQVADAALAIPAESSVAQAAHGARHLMPARHQSFLALVDRAGPLLRRFVAESGCPNLIGSYNACVRALVSLRATHRARGLQYLAERPRDGSVRVSTGLTISDDDQALEVFTETMWERTEETRSATLPEEGGSPGGPARRRAD